MGNPIPSRDARESIVSVIIDAYLSTRVTETPAWLYVLSKPRVKPAFARFEAQIRADAYEQAASYIEGKGGVIPGAAVFASLVSGNNQPCMSGDPRDRLRTHTRRQFDDATHSLATAIRALSDQPDSTNERK